MNRLFLVPLLLVSLIASGMSADQTLAKGRLLVASRQLQGSLFEQTVILLLHYDDTGAVGLIVNRPLDVSPADALPDVEGLDRYGGTLYLGGPVATSTLRSLSRTTRISADAPHIFNSVHVVPLDQALRARPLPDASLLRFYVGYAGWAPGQLEEEIRRGSWHIRAASEDVVFAADPSIIWERLVPPGREYRVRVKLRYLLAMQ